jgi:hypothetical protein
MKKNIRAVMMIVAIALVVGVNMFNSQRAIAMSDIALANVEALARDEIENVKCNREISATCILINGNPVRGERY